MAEVDLRADEARWWIRGRLGVPVYTSVSAPRSTGLVFTSGLSFADYGGIVIHPLDATLWSLKGDPHAQLDAAHDWHMHELERRIAGVVC